MLQVFFGYNFRTELESKQFSNNEIIFPGVGMTTLLYTLPRSPDSPHPQKPPTTTTLATSEICFRNPALREMPTCPNHPKKFPRLIPLTRTPWKPLRCSVT